MSFCSLTPLSRRMPVTSCCWMSSCPTEPSSSSSVPSRIFASGVLSSCDMWRRNLFFSSVDSLSRCRSHSSWRPERFDVVRPADGDRPAEIAFAELANGAVDLPQRPADEQQEQTDEHQRAGDQGGREPRELLLRRARVFLQRLEALVHPCAHALRNGLRRLSQQAEALDDGGGGPLDRARAQYSMHVLRDRREPRELVTNRRLARELAQRGNARFESGLIAVVELQNVRSGGDVL